MKNMQRRRFGVRVLGAAAALGLGTRAWARGYPSRPIRLIVPWPAAGGTDNVARLLAEYLTLEIGQPIVVENRGGANGVIGTQLVARAAPDGYTLMFSDIFSHVLNKQLVKNLPYDIVTDFTPITQISTVPLLLVVHPSLPVKNVAELVRLAREKPGQLSYASFGVGSQAHIAGEMFQMMSGVQMTHVPYSGGAPALVATLGGQVQVNFSGINLARPYVAQGKLRALAVTSATRSKFLPEVPAVAETPGFEGYEASVPFAVWGPAGLPTDIVTRLNTAIAKVIGAQQFKQRLEAMGTSPDTIGNSPAEMATAVNGYVDRLSRVVQAAHLKAE
jgi:tripartite-type tricarboxylate transporter receptor subunit TctC